MTESNSEVVEVNSHSQGFGENAGILSPDVSMLILTWVTFAILLSILYKFAWKPILMALDAREESIRKSLDDAQKARDELARVNDQSRQIISEADQKAKEIVERSRRAATEAAQAIERKAKEEVTILMTNAETEITAMQKKAQMALRQESIDLAVSLAGKLIREKMDSAKEQKLIDQLIKDFELEAHEKS